MRKPPARKVNFTVNHNIGDVDYTFEFIKGTPHLRAYWRTKHNGKTIKAGMEFKLYRAVMDAQAMEEALAKSGSAGK